jgi:hypothetical protein
VVEYMTEKQEYDEEFLKVVMEEYNVDREKAIEIAKENWVVTGRVETSVVGVLLPYTDIEWLRNHLKEVEDVSARRIYKILEGLRLPG